MKTTIILAGLCLALGGEVARAECKADELSLRWPMNGTDGKDWVINNYADLDPGAGLKDFRDNTGDAAKTYNGHQGIDIDLATFRDMDAGRTVVAAADGEVVSVQGNLFDRNFEGAPGCGDWNHVYVKHANGFVTMYGHLRFNGPKVKVGQRVTAGQALGLIGSSGCSSTVHLHFEVRDCSNKFVDPMKEGMFVSEPQYDTPLNIMDISVRKGGFPSPSTDAILKDPPTNIASLPVGGRVGIGLSVAGGSAGETINVILRRPNGKAYATFDTLNITTSQRHSWPRWWVSVPTDARVGETWQVEVFTNSNLVRTHQFRIQRTNDAIVQGLVSETYQQTFTSLSEDSYRPIFVDGSTEPGLGAKLSAVYRREGGAFRTVHNVTGDGYQVGFNRAVNAGLQVTSLDNYIADGEPRIAAVFSTPWSRNWQAYHFLTRDQHQQRFNELRAQGFRPYAISVAVANGRQYVSAAYTDLKAGEWSAIYGLNAAEYQAEFNRQGARGLTPTYLDVYDDNGTPRFSAIFTAEAAKFETYARHNITADQFFAYNEELAAKGIPARVITSYLDNGRRLYAGIWSAIPHP